MTVFIVTYEDPMRYGSDNPRAVCSTRELAQEWIDGKDKDLGDVYNIYEWLVDGEEVVPTRQNGWW